MCWKGVMTILPSNHDYQNKIKRPCAQVTEPRQRSFFFRLSRAPELSWANHLPLRAHLVLEHPPGKLGD